MKTKAPKKSSPNTTSLSNQQKRQKYRPKAWWNKIQNQERNYRNKHQRIQNAIKQKSLVDLTDTFMGQFILFSNRNNNIIDICFHQQYNIYSQRGNIAENLLIPHYRSDNVRPKWIILYGQNQMKYTSKMFFKSYAAWTCTKLAWKSD